MSILFNSFAYTCNNSTAKAPAKTQKPMRPTSIKPNTASPKSAKKESVQDLNKSSGQQKSKSEGTPKQVSGLAGQLCRNYKVLHL